MKQLALINPEHVSDEEVKAYEVREAARVIVFDEQHNIALLHVVNDGYYKLPGGGIEENEDRLVALQRECKEEIGCEVEVTEEIGSITEYRKIFTLQQISYCYLARLKGEKGVPDFTQEETARGFVPVWLPYEKALEAISQSKATTQEGSLYIVPRDTTFLQAAKEYIST